MIDHTEIYNENKSFFDSNPDIDVKSFVQSAIANQDLSIFKNKPKTRTVAEVGKLLAHKSDYPSFDTNFELFFNKNYWTYKIDRSLYPSNLVSYTTDKELSVFGLMFKFLDNSNNKSSIDDFDTESKKAVELLVPLIINYSNESLTEVCFKFLGQIKAWDLIKSNYGAFKPFLGKEESVRKWVDYLTTQKDEVCYKEDIVEKYDFVASIEKFLNKSQHTLSGTMNFVPPEFILLAQLADIKNKNERSDLITPLLEPGKRLSTKIEACFKSIRICKPDMYKSLFYKNVRNVNGEITKDALIRNYKQALMFSKCSNIDISREHIKDFLLYTIKKDGTLDSNIVELLDSSLGWKGLSTLIDTPCDSVTLMDITKRLKLAYVESPDYLDKMEVLVDKVYMLNNALKKVYSEELKYLAHFSIFNSKDVEQLSCILDNGAELFDALYIGHRLNQDQTLQLPELHIDGV